MLEIDGDHVKVPYWKLEEKPCITRMKNENFLWMKIYFKVYFLHKFIRVIYAIKILNIQNHEKSSFFKNKLNLVSFKLIFFYY